MTNFDAPIDRRGTHCVKWDSMEGLYGVSPDDGIAMWGADMDFVAPDCIQKAIQDMKADEERIAAKSKWRKFVKMEEITNS